MKTRGTFLLAPIVCTAMLLAGACRDATAPPPPGEIGDARYHPIPGDEKANFRLTGGGRVDERDHTGFDKHTPESRDFATFGFQARPTGPNTTEGSGNLTWVEHNPEHFGGGFTFHGRVTFFMTSTEGPNCAYFGGTGRARTRDGQEFNDISWHAEHACDEGEPGRGRDHIRIVIHDYSRHGLLSGGNIQKHKL